MTGFILSTEGNLLVNLSGSKIVLCKCYRDVWGSCLENES